MSVGLGVDKNLFEMSLECDMAYTLFLIGTCEERQQKKMILKATQMCTYSRQKLDATFY